MQQSVALDEDDLALLEALQREPRAPWTAVAEVVGTNAVTASRRWERLRATGAAWVTGGPGPGSHHAQLLAYVDVTCLPSEKTRVAQELAGDPHALSVDITAGGRDLLLTVAAVDLVTLGRYLLERLDRVTGVTGTRARIATRLYAEGSTWRLGVLPSNGATGSPLPATRPTVLDEVDRELMSALGVDGRASYAALAQVAGISQPTARRRVDRLISSGAVLLRTDVAAPLAGLPVMVVLSADAPAARLDEAAARLGRLHQVRLSATLAGTPSLLDRLAGLPGGGAPLRAGPGAPRPRGRGGGPARRAALGQADGSSARLPGPQHRDGPDGRVARPGTGGPGVDGRRPGGTHSW